MRQWSILVLMLLMLPLQLVWAAAAPMCAHETQASTKMHFGHHEHRHGGSTSTTASIDSAVDSGANPSAYHADCEACHLGTCAAMISPTPLFIPLPHGPVHGDHGSRYRSHIPSGLERPDRLELTAAARSDGGVEFSLHPA